MVSVGQCTFGPFHSPVNWIGKNSLEKSDFNIQFVQHRYQMSKHSISKFTKIENEVQKSRNHYF